MAYKDFHNDYKNNMIGNVVLLYGEEDYLIKWAADLIIDKNLDEESKKLDLVQLDGAVCTAYEILQAARAYSMFSPLRVIVVRDYLPLYHKNEMAGSDELLEFAEKSRTDKNYNDSSIIIFELSHNHSANLNSYGKKLAKACYSYEFTRLEKSELKAFISKRVHEAGNMIGNREMEYLIDLSGYFNKNGEYYLNNILADLQRINNACVNHQITIDVIDALMIGEDDKFVFNLVDAMMSGNKNKAMTLAANIAMEGEDEIFKVVGLLVKQFEIMYDAIELDKAGMSMNQMAKATGANEFRFKKAYFAAKGFRPERLKKLLIELYNIDKQIKSGLMNVTTAFELFVATV